MNENSNDPNQTTDEPPDMKSARGTMGKEWLMVYVFVAVIILIVALTAYHLMFGHP